MYAATSTPILCTRSPSACTNAALTARLLCPWLLLWALVGEFDWGTWEWAWEWEWEWRWPDWFSKKPILKEEKHSKKEALVVAFFFFHFKPKNQKCNTQYHSLSYEIKEVQQNYIPWESYRPWNNGQLISNTVMSVNGEKGRSYIKLTATPTAAVISMISPFIS